MSKKTLSVQRVGYFRARNAGALVTTSVDTSIAVIKYIKARNLILGRILSTGKFVTLYGSRIPTALKLEQNVGHVVPLPKGSRIDRSLAILLDVPWEYTEAEPLLKDGFGRNSLKKPAKSLYYSQKKALQTRLLTLKLNESRGPLTPDDTDDPGPMIGGKW